MKGVLLAVSGECCAHTKAHVLPVLKVLTVPQTNSKLTTQSENMPLSGGTPNWRLCLHG